MPQKRSKNGFPRDNFFLATSLFKRWGSISPPPVEKILLHFSPQVKEIRDGIFILKKMTGCPADIFTALNINNYCEALGIPTLIKSSKIVELFGADSPVSVYDVACFLNKHNYKGELRVIDISRFPLDATRSYIEQYNFALKPEQFNLINNSVLDMDASSKVDLIISDVLSLYLSPEELNTLSRKVADRLTAGGLYVSRDLVEPNGPPTFKKRVVSGHAEALGLKKFLEENFGIKMGISEIEEKQKRIYDNIKWYSRKSLKDYTVPFEKNGLRLKLSIPITCDSIFRTTHPRIFYVNVFEKQT